jgi:hypothetical protein
VSSLADHKDKAWELGCPKVPGLNPLETKELLNALGYDLDLDESMGDQDLKAHFDGIEVPEGFKEAIEDPVFAWYYRGKMFGAMHTGPSVPGAQDLIERIRYEFPLRNISMNLKYTNVSDELSGMWTLEISNSQCTDSVDTSSFKTWSPRFHAAVAKAYSILVSDE